ncbi:MAG: class I SAM-dependent methyltransferase [Candidatus Omnitrophica bacterium]|nr:class I SAM-dependent methyltransferase [Candidatus Omnitrophota bacterium]
MKKPPALSPELYDRDYYLNSLPGMEHLEQEEMLDSALEDTVRMGRIKAGEQVLDFGCGRGALAIALAKRGCKTVGIDFSKDAIRFASELRKRFSEDIQRRVQFERMEAKDLAWKNEFDVIIFNQVYEHLYDWELEILIAKFKEALKPAGRLVISTPNLNYIRFLYPLKRVTEFPFKLTKEILRLIRGRSKHAASFKTFLKEISKIKYPESEHTLLHINLQTPHTIRTFMEAHGFHTELECVDHHPHVLSLATCPWWGETIWLSCKPQT